MNSLRRPSLSDSDPKYSAPTTSPARYTVASRPASVELSPSASCLVSRATTAPATVISSPSRIQATPRAMTIRVWKGDQGNRSMRAGIRLRIAPGVVASAALVMATSVLGMRPRIPTLTWLTHTTFGDARTSDRVWPPVTLRSRAGRLLPAGDITARGASNRSAVGMAGIMRLPEPRGPLSEALASDLVTHAALSAETLEHADRVSSVAACALTDEDLQLSLALCYELHYRGFDDVADHWEWDPDLLRLRRPRERRHLTALQNLVGPVTGTTETIDRQLGAVIAADDGPSLSSYMAKTGTLEQWREYLTLRSVYHLKEGDPHTFAIPRLSGRAKAAMVEIQADEYGGGSPQRMHSELFAGLMRNLDLDATYGALWNEAPAAAFASVNTMSLFGLHRRWRGAALGHLACVEMTSSEPSRRYSAGLRRLGFDERTTVFYDEHVEADAVHEQIASVDMCGSLVAEEPDLLPDVLFGAACSLAMDGVAARHLLGAWQAGRSSLRARPALVA